MGREIRRVPPTWEHPMRECRHNPWAGGCATAKLNDGKCYHPLYDEDAETAWAEWLKEFDEWKAEEFERVIKEHPEHDYKLDEPYSAFCHWHGQPPNAEYYRPKWKEEEATAFQMYETVSEGTPVSPVCATKDALIDYLMNHGDYWSQYRCAESGGDPRWSREAAEGFVKTEWSMSMMITPSGQMIQPSDAEMYQAAKGED
jgi:hypothetical protein